MGEQAERNGADAFSHDGRLLRLHHPDGDVRVPAQEVLRAVGEDELDDQPAMSRLQASEHGG